MRLVFALLLLIHGIIHLIGFAKSYYSTEISKQVLGIPKPIGVIWLLVFIMFIVSASAFITHKKWFYIAFIAACISQILIILAWKEAKFGTLANIIILIVSISAYGNYEFNKMVINETKALLQNIKVEDTPVISEKDILNLPEIIQKWMRNSGVIGKKRIVSVRLKQNGEMKTKPHSKWLHFKAEQYLNIKQPAFVWSTVVDFMPMVKMIGRDKLINGEGDMLIKLADIIPVVNEGNNEKINSAAMIRFLAEITWFPSAALSDYIRWEVMDEHTFKGVFTIHEKSVSGIFKFSEDGDMLSFEAQRYYGGRKNATLETWLVKTKGHKDFNGFKIPSKCEVIWKLEDGDFNWLNFEITELNYNQLQIF